MLSNCIIIFIGLFAATFFLVPLNIRFSRKRKLIDIPNDRSIHKNNIPTAGGLSFALPVIFSQFFFYFFAYNAPNYYLKLALSGIAIVLIGFLDDSINCKAGHKLLLQIILVVIMYFGGFQITQITNPFGSIINLGIFSFPLTIIWFLLVMNAFNLIDGLDGLAAGIAMIAAIILFAVGIKYKNMTVAYLSLFLVSSLLSFLKYNFYPAKIFMGDTGSLFIGLNLAAISVMGTAQYKSITTMTILIPIFVLVIPFLEIVITLFRRIKNGQNVFVADKKHLHHRMLNLGFSQKTIALIGYFITFLFGLIAFGFTFAGQQIFVSILFVLFLLIIGIFIFSKEFHK